MRTFNPNASSRQTSQFQRVKITAEDLPLFHRLGIKAWDGSDFGDAILIKYSDWVVNQDKSMILKGLGGGSFEIPEMYDFFYKGQRIRIEKLYGKSTIIIPPSLSAEQDVIWALLREAFAADNGPLAIQSS